MKQVPGATEFESLRDLWQREIEAGRLEEADVLIRRALAWAREQGDPRLIDAAVCNLAAVGIHLGHGEAEISRLREILLRNSDPANCRLAAYNISIYYLFAKNYKKSLFYARIARDRSELIGRQDWLASSHNQLGNALLGESFVEDACREYEKALDLMPGEVSVWRAGVLDNLGYCRILQERYREGYSLLYQSLRMLRHLGSWRYEIMPRLDLCFAHLETGHYRHAWRHGLMALALAERADHRDAAKNALYLLGEAAVLAGADGRAYAWFHELQRRYYPAQSHLPDLLLSVDIRKLINLRA